jgi:homoserine kinase
MNIQYSETKIRVFAPATVANVASAFDILGFAVEVLGDIVEAQLSEEPGIRLVSITGDGGVLPRDPERNTATAAVIPFLKAHAPHMGVDISLEKGLPLCSGLGSSAASSAAAVFAVNCLLGNPLSLTELLAYVVEAEAVACGTAHADNAAPSLLGGFTLIRSPQPLDIISLPVPGDLCCALVHPLCEVRTEDARKILRSHVMLSKAIEQWGNVAGLIAGLYTSDYDLMGRSLRDVVIEPVRSILIPGFNRVKQAAIDSGALGCSISGSGPTVFALCRGTDVASTVSREMAAAFKNAGLDSDVYISKISATGARVIDA